MAAFCGSCGFEATECKCEGGPSDVRTAVVPREEPTPRRLVYPKEPEVIAFLKFLGIDTTLTISVTVEIEGGCPIRLIETRRAGLT